MPADASVARLIGERFAPGYLRALCWVLFCYSVFGKGFAYVGVPPLFVGEIALVSGLAIVVSTRALVPALMSPTNLVLLTLMVWTGLRTTPYLGEYGADALRDSVVVFYGLFAFIVTALILSEPRRLETLVEAYGGFAKVFPFAGLVAYAMSKFLGQQLPSFNAYEVPFIELKAGELATHIAGVSVFAMVGFIRLGWIRTALLAIATIMAISANRGSILAIAIPVGLAAVMTRQFGQIALTALFAVTLLGAAYTIESATTDYRGADSTEQRRISAVQIVNNLAGIVGQSPDAGEGTKEWREDWWRQIVADTIHGPHFWTGRGFGVNLAQVVTVGGWSPDELTPLRSPHSVHMTMLGRGGVPGLAIWILFLTSWFAAMAKGIFDAYRIRRTQWHALLLFISCYALSILLDASFDVALEGPMEGIWFWCLIGGGAGALAVMRATPGFRAPTR